MPLIKVYMSSATSDLGVKKRQQSLKFLLEKKKINVEEIDLAAIDKTVVRALYSCYSRIRDCIIFNYSKCNNN